MASRTYKQGCPSPIHGRGVFAIRLIKKGSQIRIPRFGLDTGFNHSCNANVGNTKGFDCIALRDIQVGEELTKDYEDGWYRAILRKGPCNCEVCRTTHSPALVDQQ